MRIDQTASDLHALLIRLQPSGDKSFHCKQSSSLKSCRKCSQLKLCKVVKRCAIMRERKTGGRTYFRQDACSCACCNDSANVGAMLELQLLHRGDMACMKLGTATLLHAQVLASAPQCPVATQRCVKNIALQALAIARSYINMTEAQQERLACKDVCRSSP